MEERGLSCATLAPLLGLSVPELELLLCGEFDIGPVLAESLSVALGSTPGFWLRRQENYHASKGAGIV